MGFSFRQIVTLATGFVSQGRPHGRGNAAVNLRVAVRTGASIMVKSAGYSWLLSRDFGEGLEMLRRLGNVIALVIAFAICALSLAAQGAPSALEGYFTGKEVQLKIDMPGTQKGVDLRFDQGSPMNWKEYSSRVKQFGAAIRKGDQARVTAIVV